MYRTSNTRSSGNGGPALYNSHDTGAVVSAITMSSVETTDMCFNVGGIAAIDKENENSLLWLEISALASVHLGECNSVYLCFPRYLHDTLKTIHLCMSLQL